MASDDSLPTLKLLLIGPSGAGKSACKCDTSMTSPQRIIFFFCSICKIVGFSSSQPWHELHVRGVGVDAQGGGFLTGQ